MRRTLGGGKGDELLGWGWVMVMGRKGVGGGERMAAETRSERRESPARVRIHMTPTIFTSMIKVQVNVLRKCVEKSLRFACTAVVFF